MWAQEKTNVASNTSSHVANVAATLIIALKLPTSKADTEREMERVKEKDES